MLDIDIAIEGRVDGRFELANDEAFCCCTSVHDLGVATKYWRC